MELLFYLLIQLVAIATACPLTDGDAVYDARALIASQGLELAQSTLCVPNPVKERTEKAVIIEPSHFEIYPNPASTKVFLPSNTVGAQVQIMNQVGAIVLNQMCIGNPISIEHLPSGNYTLRLQSESFAPRTAKLIVLK
jgi:hypothetical protein